jgi:hypothetical protein
MRKRNSALIWFGMIVGFGVDMPRFLHESRPPAAVVDVHAVVFTVWLLLLTAQILQVVGDRVVLHRRLGWFMAAWAGLMVVLGLWTAMVAKAPVDSGPASPQFLSVNFGSLIAFVFFVSWGVALHAPAPVLSLPRRERRRSKVRSATLTRKSRTAPRFSWG